MKLGQNIAMYRKEAGLTQEQLAEKCEVSATGSNEMGKWYQ